MQTSLESFQAFEEGEHDKTHTQRGLLPIFSREAVSLWKGCGITCLSRDVVSSGLVSPSLSQNGWQVSKKVEGEGSSARCRPRDHIPFSIG